MVSNLHLKMFLQPQPMLACAEVSRVSWNVSQHSLASCMWFGSQEQVHWTKLIPFLNLVTLTDIHKAPGKKQQKENNWEQLYSAIGNFTEEQESTLQKWPLAGLKYTLQDFPSSPKLILEGCPIYKCDAHRIAAITTAGTGDSEQEVLAALDKKRAQTLY